MEKLLLEPTSTAAWHQLVNEAQTASHQQLDHDIESYLVFLLMRFTSQPEIAQSILANEFLESQDLSSKARQESLQAVGDKCLLFAGLFPGRAERKRVRISYFVDLGQSAYSSLSDQQARGLSLLFSSLCEQFVCLMDILQAMRELSGTQHISPLNNIELWEDTRSQQAFKRAQELTDAIPVVNTSSRKN